MWCFPFFNFVLCVTPLCESNWGSGLLSSKAASCGICSQGRGQTVGTTANCQARVPGTWRAIASQGKADMPHGERIFQMLGDNDSSGGGHGHVHLCPMGDVWASATSASPSLHALFTEWKSFWASIQGTPSVGA